ncbi:MAG: HAMP domain-containing sensor histidine kinase [Chitinophagaceae bacterium]
MKRIFPIITILILLSLLGMIFFQWLWIKSAVDIKDQQIEKSFIEALDDAGMEIMSEKIGVQPLMKKNDLLFPADKMQLNIFRPSVMQRFSIDEIQAIVRKSFAKKGLKKFPFEVAVTNNSYSGDEIHTARYIEYRQEAEKDSSNSLIHAYLLTPPSGSEYENLARDEWLVVLMPHRKNIIWKEMLWFIIGAILFTLIITTAFFITIRTLLKQKKLSEIKSDFINNMTHEFKTPLATISLAVDALKNEKVKRDEEKTAYFTGIIKEENKRMNKQVETILQAALLDKQEVQLNLKKLSAHEMIHSALNNIRLQVEEKQGEMEVALNAGNDWLMADEVHFTNLVNNLLDNAVKYSREEHLKILISTCNVGKYLQVRIEDNGIGMNKETLNRIFEKFYRAHTGNIHNVKGFGLGLSYVKTMVHAHQGSIKADSILGKGSSFTLLFPLIS